jgi:hypothetical protein
MLILEASTFFIVVNPCISKAFALLIKGDYSCRQTIDLIKTQRIVICIITALTFPVNPPSSSWSFDSTAHLCVHCRLYFLATISSFFSIKEGTSHCCLRHVSCRIDNKIRSNQNNVDQVNAERDLSRRIEHRPTKNPLRPAIFMDHGRNAEEC